MSAPFNNGTQAPRSAVQAAHLLAMQGKHVHIVSEGQGSCLKGACNLLPQLPPPPAE